MTNSSEILQSLLQTPVGEHQDSAPNDVKQTRRNFNALGLDSGNPDHGYIDSTLDKTIRSFQRDMNLKEDGLMSPGGETEQHLNGLFHLVNENVVKPSILLKKKPPLPPQEPILKTKNRIIELDKEISAKQQDIDNIDKWITGISTAAGGIGGGLFAAALRQPKSILPSAALGAERGRDFAKGAMKGLEIEVDLLKENRNNLSKKLEKRK